MDFLKLFNKQPTPEPEKAYAYEIQLGPRDWLIVSTSKECSDEEEDDIRYTFSELENAGRKVIVLSDRFKLSIVRRGDVVHVDGNGDNFTYTLDEI